MKYLDGIVDIYLPDMKFMDPEAAEIYMAGADDYPACEKTLPALISKSASFYRSLANMVSSPMN